MTEQPEIEARLALLISAGGSPVTARKAIARHGSGVAAVQSSSLAARLRSGLKDARTKVDRELRTAEALGARWVVPQEGFDDACLLCVRGQWPDAPGVAVVGSRAADDYGLSIADALGCALAGCGLAVVSGAARGVDEAAHRAAIQEGGKTVAILGDGLGSTRSVEKQELLDRIAESGAVISESLTRARGSRYSFPDRNRLIASSSVATIVVQAAAKSGALHTARYAAAQGRPVFAVPGDVTSSLSAGANGLIQSGQASLLGHPRDLCAATGATALKHAQWPQGSRGVAARAGAGMGLRLEPGSRVLDALATGSLGYEELSAALPGLAGELPTILLDLELKGQIRREAGDRYIQVVRG